MAVAPSWFRHLLRITRRVKKPPLLHQKINRSWDNPPETDRYIYQVQFGPERAVRDALTARLPADHAQRRVQKDTTFKY